MEGASNVAKGLKQNMQLQTLNLAWNGFGDSMPVLPLSEALSTCGLHHLDMSHNRLDRFGTLLIAGPLAQNTTLKKFIVDGNLISQVGARALFKAAKLASEGEDFAMEISAKDCAIGIVDSQGFDPTEPSGDYDLDMKDIYSRSVLVSLLRICMSGKGDFPKLQGDQEGHNATLDDQLYTIALPTVSFVDAAGISHTIINPDESDWTIPQEGLLKFSFMSTRVRNEVDDALDPTAFDRIKDAFSNTEYNHSQRREIIDLCIAHDTVIQFKQATDLLKLLQDPVNTFRENALKQTRAYFMSVVYHKLAESHKVMELMNMLDQDSRQQADKLLGKTSFQFTRSNPTGYYNLDLSNTSSREIAIRLQELRAEQSARLQQLENYYSHRSETLNHQP